MKRAAFRRLLALVGALLLVAAPAWAAGGKGTLHIVSGNDTPTAVDRLIYQMYQRIGYDIYIEAMPMKMACESANSGEADGVGSVARSFLDDYPDLTLAEEPLFGTEVVAFARKGTRLQLNGWADLRGLQVGSLYHKLYVEQHLPPDIGGYSQYFSFYELNQALLAGEIDVAIATRGVGQRFNTLSGVSYLSTLDQTGAYPALSKAYAHLAPHLARELRAMKADGTYQAILDGSYFHNDGHKVLHISSYSPEDSWDSELQQAMLSVFDDNPDVLYYSIPLNSARYASQTEMAQNAYSALRTLIMDGLPDLVIVSDNAALNFMTEYGYQLLENAPVIYCGITAFPETFEQLKADGYYGLQEYVSALDNVNMIEKLCPDAGQILIVNDESATGQATKNSIMRDLEGYAGGLAVKYNQHYNFKDLTAEIQALPPGTPVLMGTYVVNSQGAALNRQYISRKLSQLAPGPLFSLSSFGNGETGGIRSSATLQGQAAARAALEILGGKSPSRVQYPGPEQLITAQFDFGQLNRFGLKEANLPQGANLANVPPSFRRNNPIAFWLTMLSALLICVLAASSTWAALSSRRKNRKLQAAQRDLVSMSELRSVNQRLDLALSSANACVWEIDIGKRLVHFDQRMQQIFDFAGQSPMELDQFSAIVRPRLDGGHYQFGDILDILTQDEAIARKAKCAMPGGGHKYLDVRGRCYLDGGGNAVKVLGMIRDETEQVEAVNSAQQSAVRILNSIDELIYVSDIETDQILFSNNAMLKAFHLTHYEDMKCWEVVMRGSERCGMCPKERLMADPERSYIWENVQPVLDRSVRHVDKCIKWLGGQQALLHVMFDISDIRNAEQALKNRFEQQKLIADISASLIQLGEMDQQVSATLEKIGQSFGSDRVLLATAMPDGQYLNPSYEWINPGCDNQVKRVQPADMRPGTFLHQHYIVDKERVLVISGDVPGRLGVDQTPISVGVSASFQVDGQFAGLIEVAWHEPHEWDSNMVQVLLLLGNIIAMLYSRHRIQESLVEAKEQAVQANVAKSQFLSTMSHEIRTPLNAIIGLVQVLLRSDMAGAQRGWLGQIATASEHLLSIVNDVLDMSKIEAGKVALVEQPFSLTEAMNEVEVIFRQRATESGQGFQVQFTGLEGAYVVGDKLRLKQVLINLLSNAVKFTDQGGTVKFTVDAQDEGDEVYAHFMVSDNGIGMNREQLNMLFQPFEQTKRDIATRYGGTGLGLAISQKLVEMMGGTVEVDSVPGQGSTFQFSLGFSRGAAPGAPELPVRPREPKFTGKTILVVEDIEVNRMILTELLRQTGAAFVEAENGRQALDMYLADPYLCDLILMDMQMPVMDGLEATRQIRLHDGLRERPVPIIALTANIFKEDIAACMDAGMQGHIAKPIDYDEMVKTISRFL